MTLSEMAARLSLEPLVPGEPERQVTGAYVSDLLSDVMAHARADAVWVTIQIHQNVVAVASLLNLAAVIIAGGLRPAEETVAKARAVGLPLYAAKENSFLVAGRLYELGLR
ncbi:MAG: serine kinase [Bacteroidota bacterium]